MLIKLRKFFTHNIFSAVFIKLKQVLRTENTEGNGGPQADFMGERESSEIIRKLKKIILVWIHGQLTAIHVHIKSVRADGTGDIFIWTQIIHTLSIKRGVHQATQVLRKLIKLRKFLMDDYSKKLGEMFGGMRNNA